MQVVGRQSKENERRWWTTASRLQKTGLRKNFEPNSDSEVFYDNQQEAENAGIAPGNA